MSAADPSSSPDSTSIRPATPADVPLILQFIRELATYEKLLGDVEASQEKLKATLFPADARPPAAHVLIGSVEGAPAGFAVYFFTYSTFLAKPGLYLGETRIAREGPREGPAPAPCARRQRPRMRPDGMVGSGLERALDRVLPQAGRRPPK